MNMCMMSGQACRIGTRGATAEGMTAWFAGDKPVSGFDAVQSTGNYSMQLQASPLGMSSVACTDTVASVISLSAPTCMLAFEPATA